MTGPELKLRRTEMGLSQHKLARALGVTHTTVWSWETGRGAISHVAELAVEAITARVKAGERF